jgi:hypothetical protein
MPRSHQHLAGVCVNRIGKNCSMSAFLQLLIAASMRSYSLILLAWTVYRCLLRAFRFIIAARTKCWT